MLNNTGVCEPMQKIVTPHISAYKEDFAPSVLMPGDPLRAKYVAENFLTNAVLVNNIRGVQGYTGLYENTPVSVMASGMGMPSIGIYSHELFNNFEVENIIRIGSAGSLNENVHVRDIVIGMGACTDSNFIHQYNLNGSYAPIANYELIESAVNVSKEMNVNYHVGNIFSTDVFYNENKNFVKRWSNMGVLAVEMEAAALYFNAVKANKKALAICTISDSLVTGDKLSPEERETSFDEMLEVALKVAISY